MKKKLTPEEEHLVADLAERLALTIRHIESVQDFPSGAEIVQIIKTATNKGDLRTLRLLKKEIDPMTLALSPADRERLEQTLLTTLGVSAESERADVQRDVATALKRGAIVSEKERQRLEQCVEMLEATGGDRDTIKAVEGLLSST